MFSGLPTLNEHLGRKTAVMGVRDASITWARLYVEPVEVAGQGIDVAVREMSGRER